MPSKIVLPRSESPCLNSSWANLEMVLMSADAEKRGEEVSQMTCDAREMRELVNVRLRLGSDLSDLGSNSLDASALSLLR